RMSKMAETTLEKTTETGAISPRDCTLITELPEIIIHIFQYLKDGELDLCRQVCTKWRDIIENIMYHRVTMITRDLTDNRYNEGRANERKLRTKRMQLLKKTNILRRSKRYSPAYQNGWIPLLESRDLPVGKCKPVTVLGQKFVVFRGKTATCFVLNAYCPYLGANLGTDGKVHEDCIEYPFHGWRFTGQDGTCVKLPYAEK
ncbi:cholesterol 7-desaturase-like, partial [Centruroides sculpturatus]|uniref:cholesterol 7-desaturase-like n=1 Tax=Centruroides sculpturatus TaxID=218467 RepID=UPI000C6ED078